MTVYGHNDVEDGQVYFLALIAPPSAASRDDATAAARGAVAGRSFRLYGWSKMGGRRLGSRAFPDRSQARRSRLPWLPSIRRQSGIVAAWSAADPETVDQAVRWLKSNRDSGGTNLGVALEQALRINSQPGERTRNVLIVTDAQVSDEGRLLRLVDQEAAKLDGRRINILCIDAAPNSYLVNQLVEHGGGVAKFLTSSPQETDITTALDQILTIWGEPVFTNLRLTVNRPQIESAGNRLVVVGDGKQAGDLAIDVGDLVADQSRWVVGRAPSGDVGQIEIVLQSAQGGFFASAQIDLADRHEQPALKALFGARRVNGLEHLLGANYSGKELATQLQSLGYDLHALGPSSADGIYAETQQERSQEVLRDLLVSESLAYQLPSSVVSFVAVRTEAGQKVQATVAVANALPAGWSDAFVRRGSGSPNRSLRASGLPGIAASSPNLDVAAMQADLSAPFMSKLPMPAPSMMPLPQAAGSLGSGPMGGPAASEWIILYNGPVMIENGRQVLYESDGQGAERPPTPTMITGIRVRMDGHAPDWRAIDRRVEIHVFVGDLAMPRAESRLADLLRHGERPLNLACGADQIVRIELRDPSGFFATRTDGLELGIRW